MVTTVTRYWDHSTLTAIAIYVRTVSVRTLECAVLSPNKISTDILRYLAFHNLTIVKTQRVKKSPAMAITNSAFGLFAIFLLATTVSSAPGDRVSIHVVCLNKHICVILKFRMLMCNLMITVNYKTFNDKNRFAAKISDRTTFKVY